MEKKNIDTVTGYELDALGSLEFLVRRNYDVNREDDEHFRKRIKEERAKKRPIKLGDEMRKQETKYFTLKEVQEEIKKGNVEEIFIKEPGGVIHKNNPEILPVFTLEQAISNKWEIKYKEAELMTSAKYRSERWSKKLHAEPSIETFSQRWNFEDVELAFDEGVKEGKKEERKRYEPQQDRLKELSIDPRNCEFQTSEEIANHLLSLIKEEQ